jgi:hypothetical protein
MPHAAENLEGRLAAIGSATAARGRRLARGGRAARASRRGPASAAAPLELGAAWAVAGIYLLFTALAWPRELGFDSHAYWLAWHRTPMYGSGPNMQDSYLYSPAFAQLIWPLAQLPWTAFVAVWTTLGAVAYTWLLWPVGWQKRLPLLLICVPQVLVGNIWPAFALVALFGFRRPALWAFPILTKVTAGTGVVWFAVRRDWRSLVRVGSATVVVTVVSFAISPALWIDWLRLLVGGGSGGTPAGGYEIPLAVRLPVAVALAAYAARRNRPGLFLVTIGLGSPTFAASWLLSNLAVLAALPRLRSGAAREPAAVLPAPLPAAVPVGGRST